MPYDFLIEDINQVKSPKSIGTDKGLAKIGDAIVNLAYSTAKSVFLSNKTTHKKIRTGTKVSQTILANALKNADMKYFAKSRASAHDLADTVEALIAYVWFNNNLILKEIIDLLVNNLSGDLIERSQEIESATKAFTNLLNHIKQFLPENK